MTIPGLKPAYCADDVAHVQNAVGNPLFKQVELEWSTPTLWTSDMPLPEFNCSDPFLYALVRNHGNAKTKDHIVYIGLTTAPASRFGNHPTAKGIVNRKGKVGFSYAPINFITGKNKIERMSYALEQLEHLLIWEVDEHLENEKKDVHFARNGGQRRRSMAHREHRLSVLWQNAARDHLPMDACESWAQ